MKTNQMLLGIGGVILVLVLWLVGSYNGLVQKDQTVDGQWAQVEASYQRRFDLIPNLVEATKGIFEQEQEVFGTIAQARQNYAGAQSQEEQVAAASELESAISRLLVIVENYPELRSNESVLSLMDELAGTENRVNVERRSYNDVARDYNVHVKSIPTVFIAGMFGFAEKPYFEAAENAELAPEVDLSTDEN